ncbi:aminotransferase [Aureobasidium sp. EXF-10727]|nr:aminotransferase [Aureobasidium sp. EXF-10727]KAI4723853.1 aminotransferase [Aureobasidium sp. EXF-10728]
MDEPTEIDFLRGWPAQSLLPAASLLSASSAALSNPDIFRPGLNYGDDEGHLPLRKNLAQYLTKYYDTPSKACVDRIAITGGASQNLACILQVYTDPIYALGVWVVEPSYFLAFRIFEDSGFHGDKLQGVPADSEGVDISYLETALKQVEASQCGQEHPSPIKPTQPHRKFYRHVIYCVPSFSNPTGCTMSQSRRKALIQLARKHDALIICDDVYDLVHWPTEWHTQPDSISIDLTRIVDLERGAEGQDLPAEDFGNCVSNGSFSKIVGPGCRVGWAEATPRFIHGLSQAGSTRSGGAPSQLMSTIINEFFEDGTFDDKIRSPLISEYSKRFHSLVATVEQELCPLGFLLHEQLTNSKIMGGFFIWVRLPAGIHIDVFAEAAKAHGVLVSRGPSSAVPRPQTALMPFADHMRLCFTFEPPERQEQGVRRLAEAYRSCL